MKKIKRRIRFLIYILLYAMMAAACSADITAPAENTSDTSTTVLTETATADPFDAFTVDPPNLDGMTVNFLTRPLGKSVYVIYTDICAAETTGEPLNDAIYARNQRVADNYNIDFTWVEGDASHASKSVLAQEDAYAFLNIALASHISLANSGYLTDLKATGGIDLSQPYWDANCNDLMSVCRKLYLTMGDINTMDDRYLWCYYFNQSLVSDYSLESPYDAAINGTWTYEKMRVMAESVAGDINGDGVTDQNDTWGILSENYGFYLTVLGSGLRCIEKDSEDKPYFSMNNDSMISALEKVYDIYNNKSVTFLAEDWGRIASSNVWSEYIYPMFMNNQSLFFMGHLDLAMTTFRDMENAYGIIPSPKLDENQEKYWCSGTEFGMTAISIPVSNADPGTAAMILEAMAAASVSTVTPAYYETVLLNKGLRDELSTNMLQIIMNSKTFDLGFLNNWGGSQALCSSMKSSGGKFASVIASGEEKIKTGLEKVITDYESR